MSHDTHHLLVQYVASRVVWLAAVGEQLLVEKSLHVGSCQRLSIE